MKILVAWDDSKEAEVLGLYLSAGENEATVTLSAAELLEHAGRGGWQVVLLALTFPTWEEGFALFGQLREKLPQTPVVLACRPTEMFHLPGFLNRGLRFYITRDDQGDFVFLALASLESAVAAMRAEQSQQMFHRLEEYLQQE